MQYNYFCQCMLYYFYGHPRNARRREELGGVLQYLVLNVLVLFECAISCAEGQNYKRKPTVHRSSSEVFLLHGVLRRPFPGGAVVSGPVRLQELRDVRDERVVGVRVRQ